MRFYRRLNGAPVLVERRQRQYQQALEMVDLWIAAEKALTTGKTYTIGTRSLTRVDLPEVREAINYWENEVMRLYKLLNGGGGRSWRVIPRDL